MTTPSFATSTPSAPEHDWQSRIVDHTGEFAEFVSWETGDASKPNRLSFRLTLAFVFAFWLAWYLAWSIFNFLDNPKGAPRSLVPRGLIALSGFVISMGIAVSIDFLRSRSLPMRALAAVLLSIVATLIHGQISYNVWQAFLPREVPHSAMWLMVTTDFINRLWYFLCQSAIIIALSYAADVREREWRIHALQALAQSAQLRALRNQLNPHSLFNALNSIASLIAVHRNKEAETMTENLSDFLRLTLTLDPQKLITIAEELELEKLYLDMERARFPDRLQIRVDVPEELGSALIPSLITQPLIENSIKYAVARSTRPVQLFIIARAVGDKVELVIRDDGGDSAPAPQKGVNLGLRNVAERIRTHFGNRGSFAAGPVPGGGFANTILVPFERCE